MRSNDVATIGNSENGFTISPCLRPAEGELIIFFPNAVPLVAALMQGLHASSGTPVELVPIVGGGISIVGRPPQQRNGIVSVLTTHQPVVQHTAFDPGSLCCRVPLTTSCELSSPVTWRIPVLMPVQPSGEVAAPVRLRDELITLLSYLKLPPLSKDDPKSLYTALPYVLSLSYLASVSVGDPLNPAIMSAAEYAGYRRVDDVLAKTFLPHGELCCGQAVAFVETAGGTLSRLFDSPGLTEKVCSTLTVRGLSRPITAVLNVSPMCDDPNGPLPYSIPPTHGPVFLAAHGLFERGLGFDALPEEFCARTDSSGGLTGIGVYLQRFPDVFKGELASDIPQPVPAAYASPIITYAGTGAHLTGCLCNTGLVGVGKCPVCGDIGTVACEYCKGTGEVRDAEAGVMPCPVCGGTRVHVCPECDGTSGTVTTPCDVCEVGIAYRQPHPDALPQPLTILGVRYEQPVWYITVHEPLTGFEVSAFALRGSTETLVPSTLTGKKGTTLQTVWVHDQHTVAVHAYAWIPTYGAPREPDVGSIVLYRFNQAETTHNSGFFYTTDEDELMVVEGTGMCDLTDFFRTGSTRRIIPPPGIPTFDLRLHYRDDADYGEFLMDEGFLSLYTSVNESFTAWLTMVDELTPLLPYPYSSIETLPITYPVWGVHTEPTYVRIDAWEPQGEPRVVLRHGVLTQVAHYRTWTGVNVTSFRQPLAGETEVPHLTIATADMLAKVEGCINPFSMPPRDAGTPVDTALSESAAAIVAALPASREETMRSTQKALLASLDAWNKVRSYIPRITSSNVLEWLTAGSISGEPGYEQDDVLELSSEASLVDPLTDHPLYLSVLISALEELFARALQLASRIGATDDGIHVLARKSDRTVCACRISMADARVGYKGYNLMKFMYMVKATLGAVAYACYRYAQLIGTRNSTQLPYMVRASGEVEQPFAFALFSDGTQPIYPFVEGNCFAGSGVVAPGSEISLARDGSLYYELSFEVPSVSTTALGVAPTPGLGVFFDNGTLEPGISQEEREYVIVDDEQSSLVEPVNNFLEAAGNYTVDTVLRRDDNVLVWSMQEGKIAGVVTTKESYLRACDGTHPATDALLPSRRVQVRVDVSTIIPYPDAALTRLAAYLAASVDFNSGKPETVSVVTEELAALISNPAIVTDVSAARAAVSTLADAIVRFLLTKEVVDMVVRGADAICIPFMGFADPVVGDNDGESSLSVFGIAPNYDTILSHATAIAESIHGVQWKQATNAQYNLGLSWRRAAAIAAATILEVGKRLEGTELMLTTSSGTGTRPFRCYGFGGAFSPAVGLSRREFSPFRQTAVGLLGPRTASSPLFPQLVVTFASRAYPSQLILSVDSDTSVGTIINPPPKTSVVPLGATSRKYGSDEGFYAWYEQQLPSLAALVGISEDEARDTLNRRKQGEQFLTIQDVVRFVAAHLEAFRVHDDGTPLFSDICVRAR